VRATGACKYAEVARPAFADASMHHGSRRTGRLERRSFS
jgi:hypothetical protein